MHKQIIEYCVLAFLILAPVFALTSQPAQYRLDRIDDYLHFPTRWHDFTPGDREAIAEVRNLLLKNAGEEFYDQNGMTCYGNIFMERERELFTYLEQLACLPYGTFGLYYEPMIRTCDENLRKDTLELINSTIQTDVEFFEFTADNYGCVIAPQDLFNYGDSVAECICMR
ncbi:hypothetical protein KY329_05685 [Candidatus Woesearchaeota archaeon]|nr:hypothetical protein [Candidatus Woesearchaeota archaeon]